MFKKTLLATAMLVFASIALAGPASALEPRCFLNPAVCAAHEVFGSHDDDSASSEDTANTAVQGAESMEDLADALAERADAIDPSSTDGPTVDISPEVLDAISDPSTVDLSSDPDLSGTLVSDAESDAGDTADDTVTVGDATSDDGSGAGTSSETVSDATPNVTGGSSTDPAAAADTDQRATTVAATPTDQREPATAAAAVATSQANPLIPGVVGAGLSAVLLIVIVAAYSAGKRGS